MNASENELKLLERLYLSQNKGSTPTQRDFADATGLSLGVVNAMLNRFVGRGWVTLAHLSGRKIRYVLTPSGMDEVLRRSVRYFRTTVKNALLYQKHVEDYLRSLAEKGYKTLVFEGPEDVGFLFKYESELFGLTFMRSLSDKNDLQTPVRGKTMVVMARDVAAAAREEGASEADAHENDVYATVAADRVWLSDILIPGEENPMEYADEDETDKM